MSSPKLTRQKSSRHEDETLEKLVELGYSSGEAKDAYDVLTSEHGPKNFTLDDCAEYLRKKDEPQEDEEKQAIIEIPNIKDTRLPSRLEWLDVDSVSLTWQNLILEVGSGENKRKIVNRVSGATGPGEMLVILGPSGSGKTSLLRILTGHSAPTSGDMWYDGLLKTQESALSGDVMGFGGNAAYVSQEDTLIGAITVRETLLYAAQLKRSGVSSSESVKQVEKLIKYLGLSGCADTLIGTPFFKGISGGQQRRVSLGCELVTQPSLLFLDEITSGLDSTSAYQMMNILFDLTHHGHTIVLTIHQPSSRIWDMFVEENARIMLLESGRVMYDGYADETIPFFSSVGAPVPEHTNPLDHFIDVINQDFSNDNEIVHKIGSEYQKNVLPRVVKRIEFLNDSQKNSRKVKIPQRNWFIQIWVLLKRSFRNNLRNPATYLIRIFMYGGLCLALGSLYWQIGASKTAERDRISILFFVAAFLTFMSIAAMPAFVEERAVYIREHTNNYYGPSAYSVANFLSGLPWIFLIALISSALIYGMIQSRLGGQFFAIYLANLFVALEVAESMMVAISAISPHFMVGIAGGAGLLGLYMILCGFFLMPSNIPRGWKWAHHAISFHTYSFQIFMYNEFHDFRRGDIVGNDVLKQFDMDNVSIGFNFGILMAMTAGYRIIFYFLLKVFNRTRG